MNKALLLLSILLFTSQVFGWTTEIQNQGDCINEISQTKGLVDQSVELHRLHKLKWYKGELIVVKSLFTHWEGEPLWSLEKHIENRNLQQWDTSLAVIHAQKKLIDQLLIDVNISDYPSCHF